MELELSDAERDALARFLRSAIGSNVAEFERDLIRTRTGGAENGQSGAG